jgi:hypothetical protein
MTLNSIMTPMSFFSPVIPDFHITYVRGQAFVARRYTHSHAMHSDFRLEDRGEQGKSAGSEQLQMVCYLSNLQVATMHSHCQIADLGQTQQSVSSSLLSLMSTPHYV